jgi:exo-beta-1,3-glucanase (GH17 family)/cellulose synthase/poly-beta-1,6-N-acetylglucosamine synthase-like glycosyltransferase
MKSWLISAAFAALTYAIWFSFNRPWNEPPWPARVEGFSFQPFQANQSPVDKTFPTDVELDADLRLLSGRTMAVRTYGVGSSLGDIPELAERHGMKVSLGVWIDKHLDANEQELNKAIALARAHPNVERVLVGNEVVLEKYLPIADLEKYLDRVHAEVKQPVGTAEPWATWLDHPELANHCDFIGIHLLPYWESVPVEEAVDWSLDKFHRVQKAFPNKQVIVAEVGWPSRGRTRWRAVASDANQALFLRRFLQRAEQEHITYFVMEAFDQPWKGLEKEGTAGAYWGVYDAYRGEKIQFTAAELVRVRHWPLLAAASVMVSWFVLLIIYLHTARLRNRGRVFLASVVFPGATLAVWLFYDYIEQYMSIANAVLGLSLLFAMVSASTLVLIEAHEWAEAQWAISRRRALLPERSGGLPPKVSIHVPCYNEPAEMVMETIGALARLDYPSFEVLVVDNNTRDEAVWRPVQAYCGRLGERFRFFHVAPLDGFKAGALNFALQRTAEDAEIVAVIDSDYVVDPNWLADLVPEFQDSSVAVVQAPQDYRDQSDSAFKAMCYAEYRSFFHVGMITRDERNAIIQHGTMVLVRRHVLQTEMGWAHWCITEDAELGLRILMAGHRAIYLPTSYGRGLMPDRFIDYKKQRFRWAYGAMQIFKAHARALLSNGGALSRGQQYHFVAGWLPWVADGCNLIFNLAALAWSAAMLILPERIEPPLLIFSVLPVSLFVFKLAKQVHLYQVRVGANWRQTAAAAIAGLALTHTIGVAALKGMWTRGEPFFRTPKRVTSQMWRQSLADVRIEALMMTGLLLAAFGLHFQTTARTYGPDRAAWKLLLLIQALPYACSLIVSLLSALPLPAKLLGSLPAGMHRAKRAESQSRP